MNPHRTRSSSLLVTLAAAALLAGCASTKSDKPSFPSRYESPKEAKRPEPTPDLERIALLNLQLASAYYANGQFETAYGVIARAHAAEPQNAQVLTLRALIEAELRDDVQAQQSFQKALNLAPQDPDIRHNWGVYLCKKGQVAESIEQFKLALAVPTYQRQPNTLSAMGDCLARMGRDSEALQNYSAALRMNPYTAQAMLGMAELHHRRGEFRQAQAQLTEYTKIVAPSPNTLWLQIRVAKKLGNEADVQTYGADMRRLFPTSPLSKLLDAKQFD